MQRARMKPVTQRRRITPIAKQLSMGANGKDFDLTPFEKQVIALIFSGYTSKESGQRIGVSEQSVRQHLRDIMGKLEVSTRLELVLFAFHYHVIDPVQISPQVTEKRLRQTHSRTRRIQALNSSMARRTGFENCPAFPMRPQHQ